MKRRQLARAPPNSKGSRRSPFYADATTVNLAGRTGVSMGKTTQNSQGKLYRRY